MSSKSIIKSMKNIHKQCLKEKDYKIGKLWIPRKKFHELRSASEEGTICLHHCYYAPSFVSTSNLIPHHHFNCFDFQHNFCDQQHEYHYSKQHIVSPFLKISFNKNLVHQKLLKKVKEYILKVCKYLKKF
jgi:hypothetical protein